MTSSDFVWAIDENGHPTKCRAKPENRGKRNCNHQFHNDEGLSVSEFFTKYGKNYDSIEDIEGFQAEVESEIVPIEERPLDASQEEVDAWIERLDEIAGEKVTLDNLNDVLSRMSPAQLDAINKLGFECAPAFSIPITDEGYEDTEATMNQNIAFADLPKYGVSKTVAMDDMFGIIGKVPVYMDSKDIRSNYRDGVSEDGYFDKMYSTRAANIQKKMGVREPGYVQRLVGYGMSNTMVIDDCEGDHSQGVLGCKAPGVCCKCAEQSGWHVHEGDLVGAIVATNLTEGVTQASLSSIHTSGRGEAKQEWEIICSTLKGEKSSPILKAASEFKTTGERRKFIADSLADSYEKAGISIDRYNIDMAARKMTSFKVGKDKKLRPVEDGELCDFSSMQRIGNKNNVFLQAQLSGGYGAMTKPGTYEIDLDDAKMHIMQ